MSVNKDGGTRSTVLSVATGLEGHQFTGDLPAKASAKEIDITEVSQIFIRTFTNNFVFCFANSLADAATKFASTDFTKLIGGEGISIDVSAQQGNIYIGAESGGPHSGDLTVILSECN